MRLLVDALATARLTRLVTRDSITSPLRVRLMMAVDEGRLPSKAEELVRCSWCVSIWAAAGVVAARRLAPRLWAPVALGLALSELAGLRSELDVAPAPPSVEPWPMPEAPWANIPQLHVSGCGWLHHGGTCTCWVGFAEEPVRS